MNTPHIIQCEGCQGEGVIPDEVESYKGSVVDCPVCGGQGFIYEQEYTDTELFI